MGVDIKPIVDSIHNLTDSVTKLSTVLLIVPMVFLKFVAEVGPKAHPEALQGVYLVSSWLKSFIFFPLTLSIILGLFTKCILVKKLGNESLHQDTCPGIWITRMIWGSSISFAIGMIALVYLFFEFPIEIPEPFQTDRTTLLK